MRKIKDNGRTIVALKEMIRLATIYRSALFQGIIGEYSKEHDLWVLRSIENAEKVLYELEQDSKKSEVETLPSRLSRFIKRMVGK